METQQKVGLIAGWGRLPIVTAEALVRQGSEVHCLAIEGHASDELKQICSSFREFGIARLGAQRKHLRKLGVTHATMAGKIFKTIMFAKWAWLKHSPDWVGIRYLIPHFVTGSKDRRDDSLLNTAVKAFGDFGIQLVPATDFAPELLVNEGVLSRCAPSMSQWQDIEFGWSMAKEMGRLDVGQSVVVKGQTVIAVEAIEGTDECIRRAGELCPAGGFTVVKVTKPQQDMRFDVPTIGLGTLQTMVEAGGRVLAVEANKTILLDQEQVIRFADQHGIRLVAVQSARLGSRMRVA